MKHDCDNATLQENIRLRIENDAIKEALQNQMGVVVMELKQYLLNANARLHAEANINMREICRLRGQVALLRSKIIKRDSIDPR